MHVSSHDSVENPSIHCVQAVLTVASAVGCDEGEAVGTLVGSAVGKKLGLAVGKLLGVDDGVKVGSLVG